jgi:Rrf2 family protein
VERGTVLIRQDTDYAVRALLHLALLPDGKATGAEVADACAIPGSFVYKVLNKMQKARLIASRAGRGGGFRLERDPKEITLNQIVLAVQGTLRVRTCLLEASACAFAGNCPVSAEWREVQRYLLRFLNHTTLQDLLKSLRKSKVLGKKSGLALKRPSDAALQGSRPETPQGRGKHSQDAKRTVKATETHNVAR